MKKLSKDFFDGNEVIFVGYSGKNQGFSKMIYQAFTNNGIKVYPLNNKGNGNYDVKVYNSLEELPKIPKTAYVLLNRENTIKVVGELAVKGIKKVVFQNGKSADKAVLDECSKLGIESRVCCPMMSFGKGIHKIHAFFAGVR